MHPLQYHGGYHAMTASPYGGPLSALRSNVDDLATLIDIWEARREPDAQARRAASDAVDAVDAAIRELHQIRQQLISETRAADDAAAARADDLLRRGGRRAVEPAGGRSHEILPQPGSARRVRDGQPADLRNPAHYPAVAVCKVCGRRIRCERYYLAEWRHIETEPGSD
jgi:hypothetical protein